MTQPALATTIRGRGRHYPTPDGTLVPSVTNILGLLDKSTPLMIWACEQVLTRVVDDPDRWLEMVVDDPDNAIRKGKMWWKETRDDAADAGTQIHDWLENWVNSRGMGMGPHTRQLSDKARTSLAAAKAFVAEHAPYGDTEVTVIGDGYGGTADLIGWFKGEDSETFPAAVVDYKTRKDHRIRESDILQLAALRHADTIAEPAEEGKDTGPVFRPVGPVGRAILVTLAPDGTFKAHDLTDRTGEDAIRAFHGLRQVLVWNHTDKDRKKNAKKGPRT